MSVTGELYIGTERVATDTHFAAWDPARGTTLAGEFAAATTAHVDRACALAAAALDPYRSASLDVRASFLEACAANVMALGDALLERAAAESGLPRARLVGERARTVTQLNLFADLVRQGDWLGLRIDQALPDRAPLPRSDLRMRKVPVGPVVVFGASNFPLAFSAGGGDVAAALAAGSPVIVKAHPAHPGTSALVAGAIVEAVRTAGLPSGTYSHLSGTGNALGEALVNHPAVRAVAFTGSRSGGLALVGLAARRPVPIPVYAEMSSTNPVIVLPAALATRAEALGKAFIASLSLGVGQFCTNPGLVLLPDSPDADQFIRHACAALAAVPAGVMLTPGIQASFDRGVAHLQASGRATLLARGQAGKIGEGVAALFSVNASDFIADTSLAEEVFGPSALIVRCADVRQLAEVLNGLEGQLTASLHMDPADAERVRPLLPVLERIAGRIVVNGWPTGVEVAPAMVHGGPYPATSDGRTTSVGTLAIDRFLRPVCYQDLPSELLPEELRDENAARYHPLMNGRYVAG